MNSFRALISRRKWLLPAALVVLIAGALIAVFNSGPAGPDLVATQVQQMLIQTQVAALITPTPSRTFTPGPPTLTPTPVPSVTPDRAVFLQDDTRVEWPGGSITARTLRMDSPDLNTRVEMLLPILDLPADPAAAQRFNQDARFFLQTQAESVLSWLNQTPAPDPGGQVQGRFKVVRAGARAISLLIEVDIALGGQPSVLRSSFNYDLAARRSPSLAELFAPNSAYLDIIARAALDELRLRGQGGFPGYEQNAAPLAGNYEVWAFTDGGLRFTFAENRVSTLPVSVTVPYALLKDVAAPGSALAELLP